METDREKLEHLLAGGLLVVDGLFKKLNSEGMVVYCNHSIPGYNESPGNCIDLEASEIYIEPKWWDSIPPEGILCKVWDNTVESATYRTVYGYTGSNFRTKTTWYINAIPLNEEQLAAYELLKRIGE